MNIHDYLIDKAVAAKSAARFLSAAKTDDKNTALKYMSEELLKNSQLILDANKKDMDEGAKKELSRALLDRILLNEKRIKDMAEGLIQTASLPDPIGEVTRMWKRPNGLEIGQVRVPLGVIGIIYEARPNVTVDAAGLCLKSGNAVILRGGSEAINSNIAIAGIINDAVKKAGFPDGCVQVIDVTDRSAVGVLLKLNDYIDVLIPRGGAGLINMVVQNATVPVIQTGVGNCHVYVDESASFEMAENIVINAKTQRPAVCNAEETLLVHKNIAEKFLPHLADRLKSMNVELRGCPETRKLISFAKPAADEDWAKEYLDLILAVKVVDSIDEAIDHIYKFGTKHSEAIITNDYANAQKFLHEVDAAAVYVNASTRFTDGFEFGFGGEIGISTQKLHARGPMGLNELTTTKYIIYGSGQIRD